MANAAVGARQVGEFIPPRAKARTMRNPLDKTTIVNIFPKDIGPEKKVTLNPDTFFIPKGTYEDPSVVVVSTASWFRDIDPEGRQPLLEIQVPSNQLAHSIINDWANGLLASDMNNAMPGIFFIPGAVTKVTVLKDYKEALDQAREKQLNWYRILVKLADGLWARSNGNPLVIWDEMRLGAEELGLQRVWLKDFQATEMVRCIACGNLRNPQYPICAVCKVIDSNHPLAKELKFAQ